MGGTGKTNVKRVLKIQFENFKTLTQATVGQHLNIRIVFYKMWSNFGFKR